MQKIRFAVAGTGWRAMFYVRAAKLLPEWFELTGVLCRTAQKAETFAAEHGVPAFDSLEALMETKPEFVVSCVNKAGMADMVMRLLEAGIPALSETPLGLDVITLDRLYQTQRRTGTLLQLAEQYFLWPTHQARKALISRGLLGQVHNCHLSMMHDYHAMSMMRFYLGEENGPVEIRARQIRTPIIVTGGRGGYVTSGEEGEETRVIAQLTYADGRLGMYDFAGTQYHSAIRSNHLRILGTKGEIFDDEVRFLDEENRPVVGRLEVRRDRISGTIRAVDFEGERLWENPFNPSAAMTEDEIAVCDVLRRMGAAVRTGELFYPHAHAYRDAYMARLLADAANADSLVVMYRMPWDSWE